MVILKGLGRMAQGKPFFETGSAANGNDKYVKSAGEELVEADKLAMEEHERFLQK